MTCRPCNQPATAARRAGRPSSRPAQGLLPAMAVIAGLNGCASVPGPARAKAQAPAAAVIAVAAADAADPVAARLAVYLRLLMPGGGSATEIAGFLRQNPDWPNRPLLTQRLDQALADETDGSVLGTLCGQAALASPGALLRCAGGPLPATGSSPGLDLPTQPSPAIVAAARAAWVAGITQPDQEAAFLRSWSTFLTQGDQWRRFDRLEWSGNLAAAQRTVPMLSGPDQPLAIARLSLRRGAPGADGIAAALQGQAARDPALLLDLARWLRKADRPDEALALWRSRGIATEAQVAPPQLAAFWTERDALARDLLRDHHDADAFILADDTAQTDPAARIDSAFLTGWIALRRLHDPAGAEQRFARLLAFDAAITRSRGDYWVGRARLAHGDQAAGQAALAAAAAYPTTFYGQLAAARLQPPAPGPATLLDPQPAASLLAPRLESLRDPRWSSADAIRFAGLELAQAAELLVSWNDQRHARPFLLKLDQMATGDVDHALAASLADRLGLPDVAVAIARSAGRRGLVLPQAGWPRPFEIRPGEALPTGLALAIMRQESSFDPQIVSPAGARGLMQLMPATARDSAHALGRPELAPGAGGGMLFDPDVNQTLGSAYLRGLLARFGGVVPYAVAAYNAGPHRVDRWLADNGNPAAPDSATDDDAQARMVDWIESIPFAETRNYVQRVMENLRIYQASADRRA